MSTSKKIVAILTAGGHAPCLSAAVGQLILHYTQQCPDWEIICYRSGYKGLLLGDSIKVTPEIRAQAAVLRQYGGSVIGNSRVKLTNVKDCVKRGLVKEGQNPLQCGGRTAGERRHHHPPHDRRRRHQHHGGRSRGLPASNNYNLTVVGLPKTIDNDVIPIRQTPGRRDGGGAGRDLL
jgi:pyrophosphate--fructose-6-phosphate 1-phosphotransferase